MARKLKEGAVVIAPEDAAVMQQILAPPDLTAKKSTKPRGRPFVKGVSGNPAGAAKGRISLKQILTKTLNESSAGSGRTYAEEFIRSEISRAIKGDKRACDVMWERIDGNVSIDINESITDFTGMTAKERAERIDELERKRRG